MMYYKSGLGFALCLLWLCSCGFAQEHGVYDVTAFGAVGDGSTLNTEAIQKAIDTANADGGGMVWVPRGTFLAGSLFLKSNVTLYLAENAVLLASDKPEHYSEPDFCSQNRAFESDFVKGGHFINAVEQTNVKICGQGTINGRGDAFLKDPKSGRFLPKNLIPWRPGQMVFICECRDVKIEDVLLTNTPYWTCFLHGCEDVTINGVKIRNRLDAANADGIDVDCCQRVVISNCNIETCDDAITLRAYTEPLKVKRPCENIVVTNCVLRSACQAIRVGVGDGVIRNAVFSNLSIWGTNVGLNFHSSYSPQSLGVTIDNIRFHNIVMDVRTPFQMTYGYAAKDRLISNIYFTNISGTISAQSFFNGTPDHPLKHIVLSNVYFTYPQGAPFENPFQFKLVENLEITK